MRPANASPKRLLNLSLFTIYSQIKLKCQTLKIKVEVMKETNWTCAIRLLMFDSILVFYVPGRYVYAKGNRDTARDRDVDSRQNLPNIFARKEENGNWTAKRLSVRRTLEVKPLDRNPLDRNRTRFKVTYYGGERSLISLSLNLGICRCGGHEVRRPAVV